MDMIHGKRPKAKGTGSSGPKLFGLVFVGPRRSRRKEA
jgi:hypothetical protein